jgi:hypothetical protein
MTGRVAGGAAARGLLGDGARRELVDVVGLGRARLVGGAVLWCDGDAVNGELARVVETDEVPAVLEVGGDAGAAVGKASHPAVTMTPHRRFAATAIARRGAARTIWPG